MRVPTYRALGGRIAAWRTSRHVRPGLPVPESTSTTSNEVDSSARAVTGPRERSARRAAWVSRRPGSVGHVDRVQMRVPAAPNWLDTDGLLAQSRGTSWHPATHNGPVTRETSRHVAANDTHDDPGLRDRPGAVLAPQSSSAHLALSSKPPSEAVVAVARTVTGARASYGRLAEQLRARYDTP